jgi:hypothetical protein
MGWSFRKSVGFGPFRINLSKGGVGVSGGVKGARVSVGPGGTNFYSGWGPLRYRKRLAGAPTVPGVSAISKKTLAIIMFIILLAVWGATWAYKHGMLSAPTPQAPAKTHSTKTTKSNSTHKSKTHERK